jgi:hypothetical protein
MNEGTDGASNNPKLPSITEADVGTPDNHHLLGNLFSLVLFIFDTVCSCYCLLTPCVLILFDT